MAKYLMTNPVRCRRDSVLFITLTQIGIGSTYSAHPVALASAYAALKVFFRDNVLGNVQKMEPVMMVRSVFAIHTLGL